MAQSALLAAILALPEGTRMSEFLDDLGFESDFCALAYEDDDIGEADENGASVEEIEERFDVAQHVPAGFQYLLAYATEGEGPYLLSVRPRTEAARWWLIAVPPTEKMEAQAR